MWKHVDVQGQCIYIFLIKSCEISNTYSVVADTSMYVRHYNNWSMGYSRDRRDVTALATQVNKCMLQTSKSKFHSM